MQFLPFFTGWPHMLTQTCKWLSCQKQSASFSGPHYPSPEKGVKWFHNFWSIEKDTDTLGILIRKDRKNSWEALSVIEELMIFRFIQEKRPTTFDNCKAERGAAGPVKLAGVKPSTIKRSTILEHSLCVCVYVCVSLWYLLSKDRIL